MYAFCLLFFLCALDSLARAHTLWAEPNDPVFSDDYLGTYCTTHWHSPKVPDLFQVSYQPEFAMSLCLAALYFHVAADTPFLLAPVLTCSATLRSTGSPPPPLIGHMQELSLALVGEVRCIYYYYGLPLFQKFGAGPEVYRLRQISSAPDDWLLKFVIFFSQHLKLCAEGNDSSISELSSIPSMMQHNTGM